MNHIMRKKLFETIIRGDRDIPTIKLQLLRNQTRIDSTSQGKQQQQQQQQR